jgi:hypothetical protein
MLEAATAPKNCLKVNLGITLLIAFSHKDWSQRTAHGRTSICQQIAVKQLAYVVTEFARLPAKICLNRGNHREETLESFRRRLTNANVARNLGHT